MSIFRKKVQTSLEPGTDSISDPTRKAARIFKGVFHIATLISDFDLKLSFWGDKIKSSADDLSTMTAEVASSSEEISTSMTQIADANLGLNETIGHISTDAEALNQNTKKSNEILNGIKKENTDMTTYSRDMEQSVQDLLGLIQKINEAVKGINRISEQTKLLSLNASIEAARAGEAGKGFGVVTREIRGLSVTTRELTSSIDALLDEINHASERSRNGVVQTLNSIGKIGGSIEELSGVLVTNSGTTENMTTRISEVNQTSSEINSSLQESSAALEAVNQSIQNLSESTQTLQRVSGSIHEVSAAIGGIEDYVGKLSADTGEMVNSSLCGLSNGDFIETVEVAVQAHRKWVANIKNMAHAMQVLPIQTDAHKCGFGHFYYAVKPAAEKMAGLWESVEILHHDLHKTGDLVIGAIQRGDSGQAASAAGQAEALSEKIMVKFEQMMKLAKEMEDTGESVF